MENKLQKVDHAALRVNQSFIIGLSLIAFIFTAPWLAAVVLVAMAYGTARKQPGFKIIYTGLLKPRGWVKPDVLNDNPEPHVFAQGFGALVLGLGVVALVLGGAWSVLGWSLVWLVIALASLNLFLGFCAGCAVYYWLARLNVPGFGKSAPAGSFPGMRPKGN